MKKSGLLLLISIVATITGLFAQRSQQGVYLSAADFSHSKLSFTAIQGQKYSLHLNEFLNKSTITISVGDSTYRLKKDLIFGYRDKNGISYRFYEGIDYEILNPNEAILLYSKISLGGYKGIQATLSYYFSADTSAKVQELTKWNLKNAFPHEPFFHELLDLYFNNDADLLTYDNFYRMSKVNRALQVAQTLMIKYP